jgi:hypothetical protein
VVEILIRKIEIQDESIWREFWLIKLAQNKLWLCWLLLVAVGRFKTDFTGGTDRQERRKMDLPYQ